MFELLKLRHTLHSVLDETEKSKDTTRLVQFLRAHPEMDADVRSAALARNAHRDNRAALLLTLALAEAGSPTVEAPLRILIEQALNPELDHAYHVPWDSLNRAQIEKVRECAEASGLLENLFRCLRAGQALHALGSAADAEFENRVNAYLRSGHPVEGIVDALTSQIELSVRAGELAPRLLDAARHMAKQLWSQGSTAAALDLVTTQLLADPRESAPTWLGEVAAALAKLHGVPLIRAANLLRRFPSEGWIARLKQTWIRLDAEISAEHEREAERSDLGTIRTTQGGDFLSLHAAAAVAVALGVAAAEDRGYTRIEDENPAFRELDNLIDKRNALVQQHRSLVREYHQAGSLQIAKRREIETEIKRLQSPIKAMDMQIEQQRKTLRLQWSPGRMLAATLRDEQGYPGPVRQAAAWALHKLAEGGCLDEPSRRLVRSWINRACFDRDEDDLRSQIRQLDLDPEVTGRLEEAALRHLELPSWPALTARVAELGLDVERQEQVLSLVRAFERESSPSHHFQERVVEFCEGQRLLELEQGVLDALVWMLDLAETDGDLEDWDYSEVRPILRSVVESVPQALRFLSTYPLRLMTARQHETVLGRYSRTKAGLTTWTRYTPPLWRPGMRPEQAGTVRKRYIELDDRSAPNAMGISWRLFAHRVLAVPVIYHEFMHYGGPAGDPAAAIDNECEVHLREVIFTRGLIARMAPEDDGDISEYERQLVSHFGQSGGSGSLARLLLPLDDEGGLNWLNHEIQAIYGAQMTEPDALAELGRMVEYENMSLCLMNAVDERKLNWQPEIEWPLLMTSQTGTLSERFSEIVLRSLTTRQTLDPDECGAVLRDLALKPFQEDWIQYAQRPLALRELVKGAGLSRGAWA